MPILLSDSITKFTIEVLSINKRKQVFPRIFLWEKLNNVFFRHGIQFLVKYCVFCMNSNGTRYSETPYIYIHIHLQYIITHTFIILLVMNLCMEWDALVSLYTFLPSTCIGL